MKNKIIIFCLIFIFVLIIALLIIKKPIKTKTNLTQEVKPKPLEIYSLEKLSQADIPEGQIKIGEKDSEKDKFESYLINFEFIPKPDSKIIKKTSGLINIPKPTTEKYPLIIMVRGYIDPSNYTTGTGSKNLGYFLAENGFLTVAPDFLGYGQSDKESGNIFESRFQTYTTILSLIKSVNQLKNWDGKNIFLWGHSNGGQIVLYTLEATGAQIPTVFWAPVSKPFPYSILYYTDESQDHGRLIRQELAKFEEDYDVEKFSVTNYFNRIKAPILILQGTADEAVPEKWSQNLYKTLLNLGLEVNYIVYSGADHNLRPTWNEAAQKTLDFFKSHTLSIDNQ